MVFSKWIAIGAVFASLSSGVAMASDYDACSNGGVLDRIQSRFTYTASHYLNMDLAITDIEKIRENRLVAIGEAQNVERHYCQARARMSDGKSRHLYYVVEDPWGFASIGDNVTYCVAGLDPLYLHGYNCHSER